MKSTQLQSWREVRNEIILRIRNGFWQPGELIPKEIDLANEFNCARATVNRALRALAEDGLLDRRRKGGTRVVTHPVRRAKLDIPIIRHEIERLGGVCRHEILYRKVVTATSRIQNYLKLSESTKVLQLNTLYFSDNKPFAYETRWINLNTAPKALEADLSQISANEWLINNIPLTTGNITFSAKNATAKEAEFLNISKGEALFIVNRTTWVNDKSITYVQLCYAPGFSISTSI